MKDVQFSIAVTEHIVIAEMAYLLNASDSSTSIFPANIVRRGSHVLLSIPGDLANHIEDINVYNIVLATNIDAACPLCAFRVARAINWTDLDREWAFLNFNFERGVLNHHHTGMDRR